MGGNTEAQREDGGSKSHLACNLRLDVTGRDVRSLWLIQKGRDKDRTPVTCQQVR